MKNIYNDDSFSKESADVFSKSSYDFIKEFNQMNPEKPKADISVDFTENNPAPAPAATEAPAKQAPPPIKRAAHPAPAPTAPVQQTPPPIYYAPSAPQVYPQGQPVYVPQPYPQGQPVYYPGGVQPVPVFMAPDQPYPAYPQPIPVQPGVYPGQPVYQPQPVYAQPPVVQNPAPYPQAQPTPAYQPPVTPSDPISKEAGTRVLFQSPDFDKKDDVATDAPDTVPHEFAVANSKLDISEVELPSRKRAGSAPGSDTSDSFKIDEMEIGTYELRAMSLSRPARSKGLEAPQISQQKSAPIEHKLEESLDTDEIIENSIPAGIFPQEILEDEEKEEVTVTIPEEKGKKAKLGKGEIIRRIVLGISVIAIVVSAAMLYKEYDLHKENENAMSNISDLIITEPVSETTEASTTVATDSTETTKKKATTTTKPTTTKFLTPSEQFELLKKQNPNIVFPDNIQLKYAKLYAENQDFVGYLHIEGSEVDFPVVQGYDDDEYLEKSFFGEYTKYGCPFMTYRNNPKTLDMNTVIYGHNMKDGSLFATLEQYLTLEGYKEAPVISFNTLYQDFNFKIISVMITNIYPEDDNGYVFPYYWTNLNSTLNYTTYLNQLTQRSLYDTGVNVLPTDRLITLSTCYDVFEDSRLVVVGRLVRPGESSQVDTSKAVENSSPRFPQAYYDEYGRTNPYANAYKWEIS